MGRMQVAGPSHHLEALVTAQTSPAFSPGLPRADPLSTSWPSERCGRTESPHLQGRYLSFNARGQTRRTPPAIPDPTQARGALPPPAPTQDEWWSSPRHPGLLLGGAERNELDGFAPRDVAGPLPFPACPPFLPEAPRCLLTGSVQPVLPPGIPQSLAPAPSSLRAEPRP